MHSYMTLPLAHIQTELAFENLEQANQFLEEHQAANYVKPAQSDGFPALSSAVAQSGLSKKQQRALLAQQQKSPVLPLEGRIWDCKASHAACESGNDRYRTVDLKGQI
jgi:hypothetical protein